MPDIDFSKIKTVHFTPAPIRRELVRGKSALTAPRTKAWLGMGQVGTSAVVLQRRTGADVFAKRHFVC